MSTGAAGQPLPPFGRLLLRLCQAFAIIGGVALVGITIMTLTSVIGRSVFSHAIQGDFELVQLACSVCVAAFLPYTQWQRANIIVDFFTTRASVRTQRRLDAFGALLVALVTGACGSRTIVGAIIEHGTGETSMLMGVPIWISYAFIAPGLLLTAVVALYGAWQSWTEGSRA